MIPFTSDEKLGYPAPVFNWNNFNVQPSSNYTYFDPNRTTDITSNILRRDPIGTNDNVSNYNPTGYFPSNYRPNYNPTNYMYNYNPTNYNPSNYNPTNYISSNYNPAISPSIISPFNNVLSTPYSIS